MARLSTVHSARPACCVYIVYTGVCVCVYVCVCEAVSLDLSL